MDSLIDTLRDVMRGYAKKGLNGQGYYMENEEHNVFAVISLATMPKAQRIATAGLIVHVVNDKIIIERDMNDKILLDALLQAGIPREQIVLAYAGESVPMMP